VLCAVHQIFTAYGNASSENMSVDQLRGALSYTYQHQARFQLKQMDDAAEVYEAILESIHLCLSDREAEDCVPACLAHRTLYLPVKECGSSGQVTLSYNKAVQYVSVASLVETAGPTLPSADTMDNLSAALHGEALSPGSRSQSHDEEIAAENGEDLTKKPRKKVSALDFGRLIGAAVSEDAQKGENGQRAAVKAKPTEVLAVGLNWPSAQSPLELLESLTDLISPVVDFTHVYDVSEGGKTAQSPEEHLMLLRGMICYYGQHYIAFVFNPDVMEWTLFDDAVVKSIGPNWADLTMRCLNGHYQPSLLFYQRCSPEAAKEEAKKFDDYNQLPKKKPLKAMSTTERKNKKTLEDEDQKMAEELSRQLNIVPTVSEDDERLAKGLSVGPFFGPLLF